MADTVLEGYSAKQAYDFYRKDCKDNKEKYVGRSQHWDICKKFNKMLSEAILEGKHVKLPFGLGMIYIKKFKHAAKKFRFDYGEYNKTGKKLVHLNEHSDGFTGYWYWRKRDVRIAGVLAYSFKEVRANSRALAQIMKKEGGHKRFIQ